MSFLFDWTSFDWKNWADSGALLLLISSLVDWLPPVAAGLSIIWLLVRLYETPTVQMLLPKRFRLARPKYRDDPD